MAGDTTNARQWSEADVYVSWNLNATIPATIGTAWGADWHLVGLLDGDDGFTYAQSEDETDLFAWGGIIVKTSRKNFKQTVTFGALEWNDVTRRLRWPGSNIGEIFVPSVESTMIGFETREGTVHHRVVSANYAEIAPDGDVNENETDLSKIPFIATIIPDTSSTPARLFWEYQTAGFWS